MILIYIFGLVGACSAEVKVLNDLQPPKITSSNSPSEEYSTRLKGLYVPDNLEKLYDDGSDKSPPAPVVLAPSPFGPVPAGSGIEGQYVPDNLEKNFDDGSDKSPPAPKILVPSPFGPVPAGSGTEGQYVPDNLEKNFDDGSDKSPPTPEILAHSPFGLVPAGSGAEGQYVPDNLEKNFDDGSDKSPPAPVPLVRSPYGLVPAGSGAEGQYVPDNLEKMYDLGLYDPDLLNKKFDDGLYKTENAPELSLGKSYFESNGGQYTVDNAKIIADDDDDGRSEGYVIQQRFREDLNKDSYNKLHDNINKSANLLKTSTSDSNEVPHGLVQAGVGFIPS